MEQENFAIDDFKEDDKVQPESEVHDFNEQNIVIGILDRFEDSPNGQLAIIKVNRDEEIKVGSYTALKHKLTVEDIGKKVKIEYLGEVKSKNGRVYMNFDVYKK